MVKETKIDEIDCRLLDMLQKNCRTSYTKLGKEVDLSVDSVKKRVNKMISRNIFFPKIQLRPRNFGFNNIVDVKIKLHNYDDKQLEQLISFLKNHQRIVELFSVSGDWDFSMVIIAKDAIDLGKVTREIKKGFGSIINGWQESLTTAAYKFESYDMDKLVKDIETKTTKIK